MNHAPSHDPRHIDAVSRKLLLEEIGRIVSEANASRQTLHTGHHAARLHAAYPAAGFSVGRIIDELVLAATEVGLPVEMSRPD